MAQTILLAIGLIGSLHLFKAKHKLLVSIIILFTCIYPTKITRLGNATKLVPNNLYLEPVTLYGTVFSILPSYSPGKTEIKARGTIGGNDLPSTFKLVTTDLPATLTRIELNGHKIVCSVDSSNISHTPKTLSEILNLYRSDTLVTFTLDNNNSNFNCHILESADIPLSYNYFLNLDSNSRAAISLLHATCLGEKGHLEKWITELFKNTGLYHLLVVSGFHLGLILLISGLFSELALLIFPQIILFIPYKSFKAFVAIFLSMLFLFLCEPGKPLIRAAIIAFSVSFGQIINRKQNIFLGLLWSLVILSLFYPFCLTEPGVQLSYAAIIGVINGANIGKQFSSSASNIEESLENGFEKSKLRSLKEFFIASIFCSLGAFIMVSPIQYYWFGTFSMYSLLFNVVFATPFSYLVILPGFLILIIIYIAPTLGMLLLSIHSQVVIHLINWINYLWEVLP